MSKEKFKKQRKKKQQLSHGIIKVIKLHIWKLKLYFPRNPIKGSWNNLETVQDRLSLTIFPEILVA